MPDSIVIQWNTVLQNRRLNDILIVYEYILKWNEICMSFSSWLHQLDFSYIYSLALSALAALLSITVHESAHGFAAYKLGDPTAKNMGRISLNPLKHIDPIGFVMLVIAHVGWAKPVPIDARYFKNPRRGMAISALAGPVSNIILAFLALCAYYWCVTLEASVYVMMFAYQLAMINCGLAVFNLIPIPPLDGSKVLFAMLSERTYWKIMRYERFAMPVLIALVFFGFLDGFVSNGIDRVVNALWHAVIMIFSVF